MAGPLQPTASTLAQNEDPNADTSMVEAAPGSQDSNKKDNNQTKKRKRSQNKKQPHILHQTTFRNPPWTYFHLRLLTPSTLSSQAPSSPTTPTLSPLTILPLLTTPLTSYLGTTGSAIPIDILHTQGHDVWIRVPREDGRGVRAGLSGWVGSWRGEDVFGTEGGREKVQVGWRVVGESGVLVGVLGGEGEGVGADGRGVFEE
ncbi:hypothetical protein IQ07DRAFT_594970 [Pyrenochaeta sp. DS3sAY3a]|nr:hypothetical protein IQ07DRAFT_594970 [Pyrenochaeta sp. DS3sAY3a]